VKHTVLHAIPAVLVEAIVCIADVITSWTPEDAPYAARLFWRGRRLRRVEITGFPSPESINCERSDVVDAAVTVQQVMDYEDGVWFWDEAAGGGQ
jgi:hypothetical protein